VSHQMYSQYMSIKCVYPNYQFSMELTWAG
jgi:hypothetical protein